MIDRKLITFIGCAMVHVVIGTIYCTGNIMPYVASYIGLESGYISIKSMTIVFYICVLSWSVTFQPAALIQTRFTPKKSIYLGTILYLIVVFVTAALKTRIAIIIVYGVILGIGSGFAYAPSLMTAISCYPDKKGMVTGIIIGCFALGSFIFNFVATAVVNPENKKPLLSKTIDGVVEKFFEEDVAKNVPRMFLILASIYTAIIIPALFMIKDTEKPSDNKEAKPIPSSPKEDNHLKVKDDNHDDSSREHSEASSRMHSEHEKEEEKKDNKADANTFKSLKTVIINPDLNLTVWETFRTRQVYQIFFATMFSGTAGMFAIASFKTIGLEYGYDDSFLTIVGSLGSIMNGTNRPFWGYLFDKRSYRFAYMIICCVQIAICFTFPAVNMYQAAFLIWLCILYSCSGGTFTQLAPIAVRIYGRATGVKVYAFFIFAMGLASMAVYFIQTYVVLYVDNSTFFYILGGLSTCSLISNCFFNEIIVWSG